MLEVGNANESTSYLEPPKLHPVVLRLLQKRGISSQQANEILETQLSKLPDLTDLIDLPKAADFIVNCLVNNKKIIIFGDYDVDGTTSCALLYRFFKMLPGHQACIITMQPSRFEDGYGLHPVSVDRAKEMGADLIITVDCGITAVKAGERAQELGIPLIITDHHKDGLEELPYAVAVVNPNRRDVPDTHPLKALAGVGVAFCLAVKIRAMWEIHQKVKVASLIELLPYVAMGTICDLARLTPVNLKLVRRGFMVFENTEHLGLRQFWGNGKRSNYKLNSEFLGFFVGPLINAKGRLEHAMNALKLLTTEDHQEAFHLYQELVICNDQRKKLVSEQLKIATELANDELHRTKHAVSAMVIYHPDFHEGILGILASKLVERFHLPAIVLTKGKVEGELKGSGRSFADIDLFAQLQPLQHFCKHFGGHKKACGLTLFEAHLSSFKDSLSSSIALLSPLLREKKACFELVIDQREIEASLMEDLEKFAPFGEGNPSPVFYCDNLVPEKVLLMKEKHLKINFKSPHNHKLPLSAIMFNYTEKSDARPIEELVAAAKEQRLATAFTLGINEFNNQRLIQLMLKEIYFKS